MFKKTSGWIKGAPTAMVVSIAIHLLLFFVLGGMVVFSVVKKKIEAFKPPPPIERPKMDLKRPKVKVKKQARPKSFSRIVSKSVQSMTDFAMPETSALSEGLTGGAGFELKPDVSGMSMFGGENSFSVGNDWEGTFYSMAYDRRGKETAISYKTYVGELRKFSERDWNPNVFARYFRSPRKLYATQIMVPPIFVEYAPSQFIDGMDSDFDPRYWCVHYNGKFAYKKGGRIRFAGAGDDHMLVRVNGEIVFNACWGGPKVFLTRDLSDFRNPPEENKERYPTGLDRMQFGAWFELEAGEPAEFDVIIGNSIQGAAFMLMVQEEGVEYKKNPNHGGPILPVFKTAEMPESVRYQIEYLLIEGEADLIGGPLFNVH